MFILEAVEQALDLGLVARVERAADAGRRPALVDAAVLRARRVRADRRRVDERGDSPAAAALNTRALPSTFTSWRSCLSRPGWISQAKCTTASAPWKSGRSGERAMSAWRHSVFGKLASG